MGLISISSERINISSGQINILWGQLLNRLDKVLNTCGSCLKQLVFCHHDLLIHPAISLYFFSSQGIYGLPYKTEKLGLFQFMVQPVRHCLLPQFVSYT